MNRPRLLASLLFGSLVLHVPAASAASLASPEATRTAATDDNAPRHQVRGVVKGLFPEKDTILIKHEEIVGFMKAMTMAFRANATDLAKIKVGDTVTATIVVRDDDFYLENVQVAPAKK